MNQQVQNTSRACMVGSSISFPSESNDWKESRERDYWSSWTFTSVLNVTFSFSTLFLLSQYLAAVCLYCMCLIVNKSHVQKSIVCVSKTWYIKAVVWLTDVFFSFWTRFILQRNEMYQALGSAHTVRLVDNKKNVENHNQPFFTFFLSKKWINNGSANYEVS